MAKSNIYTAENVNHKIIAFDFVKKWKLFFYEELVLKTHGTQNRKVTSIVPLNITRPITIRLEKKF